MWNDSDLPPIPSFKLTDRPLAIRVLRDAKTWLWDGKGDFDFIVGVETCICFAILRARANLSADATSQYSNEKVLRECKILTRGISDALGDDAFATRYLARMIGAEFEDISPLDTQSYRHRWLDLMIESVEKQAD